MNRYCASTFSALFPSCVGIICKLHLPRNSSSSFFSCKLARLYVRSSVSRGARKSDLRYDFLEPIVISDHSRCSPRSGYLLTILVRSPSRQLLDMLETDSRFENIGPPSTGRAGNPQPGEVLHLGLHVEVCALETFFAVQP